MTFVDDVRETVRAIPAGSVASYGDVGRRVGVGPRQVGRAMSLLDETVPLLDAEATPMRGARVDMARARHRWTP